MSALTLNTGTPRTKVGDLRPSQLLGTFGVGAIVDLPNFSAMVMGLDDWPIANAVEIGEERLLAAVKQQLGPQVARLMTPPVVPDTGANPFDDMANIGVPVAPFPRWVLCPSCRLIAPLDPGLFELKIAPYRPDRTRYVHRVCSKPGRSPDVMPARFLVACERGHLDDFPWLDFVHRTAPCLAPQLRLLEGDTGEAVDITVKCVSCQASRRMSDAFGEDAAGNLGACRGRRPQLRDFESDGCQADLRGMLLGASNSWFADTLSALSIPSGDSKLAQLVDENWVVLNAAEAERDIEMFRRIGQIKTLSLYSPSEIWDAVERNRNASDEPTGNVGDLKRPEWEVFSNPDPAKNGRDFWLRQVDAPAGYENFFDKIVLAERLREVRALTGFTRINPPGDFGDPDSGEAPPRAPLSRTKPKWVPTAEVRGEGIFLQFNETALQSWVEKCSVLDQQFLTAHRRWRSMRRLDPNTGYPTIRFVLLHSFAHALIRQLALECGYTAASIRERIYSSSGQDGKSPMAGVLIYTAAPDSEGTLGGLVSLGEPDNLSRHLDQALDGLRLCAADPLCAEAVPNRQLLSLHGAACHACLFAPETSCERGNKYLDRSTLIATVERSTWAFFE